jgi:hypothetical protein
MRSSEINASQVQIQIEGEAQNVLCQALIPIWASARSSLFWFDSEVLANSFWHFFPGHES